MKWLLLKLKKNYINKENKLKGLEKMYIINNLLVLFIHENYLYFLFDFCVKIGC